MPAVPALLETQRRFLAALYDADAAGPLESIVGNGLGPAALLRIYRHSCDAIQTGALRISYPAVLALVGEAFFVQAARGYRTAYPSHAGNLQDFGDRLGEFLASLPALRAMAYLPDVARLEWLRQQAALAAEATAWPLRHATARAARLRDDRARAVLHPSVFLLASPHAVLSVWRYAMEPTPERLELPATGEQVLLWREGDQVAMAALDPASFACIESLARGSDFADARQAGRAQDPDFDFDTCTESLIERGLLAAHAAFDFTEETPP